MDFHLFALISNAVICSSLASLLKHSLEQRALHCAACSQMSHKPTLSHTSPTESFSYSPITFETLPVAVPYFELTLQLCPVIRASMQSYDLQPDFLWCHDREFQLRTLETIFERLVSSWWSQKESKVKFASGSGVGICNIKQKSDPAFIFRCKSRAISGAYTDGCFSFRTVSKTFTVCTSILAYAKGLLARYMVDRTLGEREFEGTCLSFSCRQLHVLHSFVKPILRLDAPVHYNLRKQQSPFSCLDHINWTEL